MLYGGSRGVDKGGILSVDRHFFFGSLNIVNDPNVQDAERRLVDAAAAGERDARRALFEAYREAAYRVALRITGREEDALDVVQDAFIKAFDGLTGFQRESGFKTWLLRIATNRALDVLRARKVRLAVSLEGGDGSEDVATDAHTPVDDATPGDSMERVELEQRLQRAIEALPPDQKSVFSLFALKGLTYGEIADVVGIPIGTVMSRLFHARKKLHGMLADLMPEGLGKRLRGSGP